MRDTAETLSLHLPRKTRQRAQEEAFKACRAVVAIGYIAEMLTQMGIDEAVPPEYAEFDEKWRNPARQGGLISAIEILANAAEPGLEYVDDYFQQEEGRSHG